MPDLLTDLNEKCGQLEFLSENFRERLEFRMWLKASVRDWAQEMRRWRKGWGKTNQKS